MLSTFFFSALILGCSAKDIQREYGAGAYTIKGDLHFTHVEMGCWGFTANDGTQYELSGTALDSLQQRNYHAEIIVRDLPNIHSTCMAGTFVEVLHIINIQPQEIHD